MYNFRWHNSPYRDMLTGHPKKYISSKLPVIHGNKDDKAFTTIEPNTVKFTITVSRRNFLALNLNMLATRDCEQIMRDLIDSDNKVKTLLSNSSNIQYNCRECSQDGVEGMFLDQYLC